MLRKRLPRTFFSCFLQRTVSSNDDVGAARATVFREIRPVPGFKNGDFVKRKVRGAGATVERLTFQRYWGRQSRNSENCFPQKVLALPKHGSAHLCDRMRTTGKRFATA